jgi:hypothetical protein
MQNAKYKMNESNKNKEMNLDVIKRARSMVFFDIKIPNSHPVADRSLKFGFDEAANCWIDSDLRTRKFESHAENYFE